MCEKLITNKTLQDHIYIDDENMEIVRWITDSKDAKTITEWETFLKEKGIKFGYVR